MSDAIDRQYAEMVLTAVFRASRELGEMGTMAREFCSPAIGTELKQAMGQAIGEMGQVAEKIYDAHPDLRSIVEARIEKYGRWS